MSTELRTSIDIDARRTTVCPTVVEPATRRG